ncbi:MAG: hypothetical protein HN802_04825 [Candidatus Jacksonbacteria bacterium]|jgi:hypothetical protein|nr:hypothetical protein [Candidatus Jacksonbacteria bacterium]
MALQQGKRANISITGVVVTDVIIDEWSLEQKPVTRTYTKFGDDAPTTEVVSNDWEVVIGGYVKAGAATFPAIGASVTDLDLILEDAVADLGFTCSAGIVTAIKVGVKSAGSMPVKLVVKPAGSEMVAYGTVT